MDQSKNKSVGDMLQAETYQAVEEINREIEMTNNEIDRVANSPILKLKDKIDQIDLFEQEGLRLLESRSNLLGRAYHRETGPFIVRISRLKTSLTEGKITDAASEKPQVTPPTSPVRKPFIPENNHKFDRHRELQNIFIGVDEVSFPKIATAIGLIKTLKEYKPGSHRQIIISLQKRMNPKFKKEWDMMLSSKNMVNGLCLIRTKNS